LDIWALWRSGLSVRVPECRKIKNGGLDQYGTEHVGILIFEVKGLKKRERRPMFWFLQICGTFWWRQRSDWQWIVPAHQLSSGWD